MRLLLPPTYTLHRYTDTCPGSLTQRGYPPRGKLCKYLPNHLSFGLFFFSLLVLILLIASGRNVVLKQNLLA